MKIKIHRIYDDAIPQGYRALVDRLWPRGIAKNEADLDGHWKDLAPSDHLRKWFDHDADKWAEFRNNYLSELSNKKDLAKKYLNEVSQKNLILLYAAKDKEHTHALILQEYLVKLL